MVEQQQYNCQYVKQIFDLGTCSDAHHWQYRVRRVVKSRTVELVSTNEQEDVTPQAAKTPLDSASQDCNAI